LIWLDELMRKTNLITISNLFSPSLRIKHNENKWFSFSMNHKTIHRELICYPFMYSENTIDVALVDEYSWNDIGSADASSV
jgi:hypothetical protein